MPDTQQQEDKRSCSVKCLPTDVFLPMMSDPIESVWGRDVPSAFWHFINIVTSQQESDSYTKEKVRVMDIGRCNLVFKGKR